MSFDNGCILPYGPFRQDLGARRTQPVHWPWRAVQTGLGAVMGAEMAGLGLLALSRTTDLSGCETVPGLSLSVQSLEPGASTPRHAHAWWHVYVIQAGSGTVTCGEEPPRAVTVNDVVFIPAWCQHALANDGAGTLTALNLSNMVQQASLANFQQG